VDSVTWRAARQSWLCAKQATVAVGGSGAPDSVRTGLADPPEDWPAASPRDAAAVTPREPILARDGFKSDSDVFYDWNLSERTLRCIVS